MSRENPHPIVIPGLERLPICLMAELSHETLSAFATIEYTYSKEPSLTIGSEARAVVSDRKGIIPRLIRGLGMGIRITPQLADKNVVVTDETLTKEAPVIKARRLAIAEALFAHLASNCVECSFSEYCKQRLVIADKARTLQLEEWTES
jgi:hypothetical protein